MKPGAVDPMNGLNTQPGNQRGKLLRTTPSDRQRTRMPTQRLHFLEIPATPAPGPGHWSRGGGGGHCLPGEQLGSLPRTGVRNVHSCRLTPAPSRVGAKRGREAAPGPEDTARPGRPGRLQAEKLTAHQAPPAQDAWEDMRLPHPGALGLESTRLKLQPVPVAFPFPETFATGGAPGRE